MLCFDLLLCLLDATGVHLAFEGFIFSHPQFFKYVLNPFTCEDLDDRGATSTLVGFLLPNSESKNPLLLLPEFVHFVT